MSEIIKGSSMFQAERVAKMKKNNFYAWLSNSMKISDSNGEYEKKWIEENPFYVLKILFQWVEDWGDINNAPIWLCVAIIKLKNYLEKGGE